MINFSIRNGKTRYGAEKQEYSVKYFKQKNEIDSIINDCTSNKYILGLALKKLWDSGDYSNCFLTKGLFNMFIGTSVNKNLSQKAFFAVCEYDFGLDKSAVSRLINVVDEFCDKDGNLKEEYKKYKYSVLCEMLPLNIEQRKKITSDYTVSMVREYKRYLLKSVNEESDLIVEKPKDEFSQFKDWKRIDFCKRIVALELENRELQAALEKYKKAKKNVKKS